MPVKGRTECAVRGCGGKIVGSANLCRDHAVPGLQKVGDRTMIITLWYAEHGTEYGTIMLNDLLLGELFGGQSGFKAMLASQGFEKVRLIATPQDLELGADPLRHVNQSLGEWTGPWQPLYPWEKENKRIRRDVGTMDITSLTAFIDEAKVEAEQDAVARGDILRDAALAASHIAINGEYVEGDPILEEVLLERINQALDAKGHARLEYSDQSHLTLESFRYSLCVEAHFETTEDDRQSDNDGRSAPGPP